MSEILVPVSFGELLDKIAILQIKSERMTDPAKLANVRDELSALEKTWMAHPAAGQDIVKLRAELKAVNERLWVIEDDIRLKEKAQAFDDGVHPSWRAAVYFENDDARADQEGHQPGAGLGLRRGEVVPGLRQRAGRVSPAGPQPWCLRPRLEPLLRICGVAAETLERRTASSTVIRSITPSASIFVPHFRSAAGLPRNLRAASS